MFTTLFLIGAVGFAAMLFLSFGHAGGSRGAHHGMIRGGGHLRLGTGHTSAHVPGHQGSGAAKLAPKTIAASGLRASPVRSALAHFLTFSPIDIFSVCLGMGAGGLLLQHAMAGKFVVLAALGCGVAYNWLLIHPVMNLCLRFVSRESGGLEGAVSVEVEAISNFDANGQGLVRLTLDGQLRQLLANLEHAEHERGVTVRKGDKVVILEVDAVRNICTVSRDLAA